MLRYINVNQNPVAVGIGKGEYIIVEVTATASLVTRRLFARAKKIFKKVLDKLNEVCYN